MRIEDLRTGADRLRRESGEGSLTLKGLMDCNEALENEPMCQMRNIVLKFLPNGDVAAEHR